MNMINQNGKFVHSPSLIPKMMNPQQNYFNQQQQEMNPNMSQMNYPRNQGNPQMMERNPQMSYGNGQGNMMVNKQYQINYSMMNPQQQQSQSQLYPGNFNQAMPNQGIRMTNGLPLPGMNIMNSNSPRGQINNIPAMNMGMNNNNMVMAQMQQQKNQAILNIPQPLQGMNKSPRVNPLTIPNMQNNMSNMNLNMSQTSTMNTSNMSSIPFIKITNENGSNPINNNNVISTSSMSNCSPRSNPQYPGGYSVNMINSCHNSPTSKDILIPTQQQQFINFSPSRNNNTSPIPSLNFNQMSPVNPQISKIPQINQQSPIQVMNQQIPRPISPVNQISIPIQASPNRNSYNDFQASMQMMSMISKNLMMKQSGAQMNKSPQPMTNINPMVNMPNMGNMPYMNNNLNKSPTMNNIQGINSMPGMPNMQGMNNMNLANMSMKNNMNNPMGTNSNMNSNIGMNNIPNIPNIMNIPNLNMMNIPKINPPNIPNMNNASNIPNMPINPYLINKICNSNMAWQNQNQTQTQRNPVNTGFKRNITIANGNKKSTTGKPPSKYVKSEKNIVKTSSSSSITSLEQMVSKDKLLAPNLLMPFNTILKDSNHPILSLQFILPNHNEKVIEIKNNDNLTELLTRELKDLSPEIISVIIARILNTFKQAKQVLNIPITQHQKKTLYKLKQHQMKNHRKPINIINDKLNCSCHFENDLHKKEVNEMTIDIERYNYYPIDLNVTF